MKKIILTTDRLVLREMYRDDVESLLEMFQDPDVMRYYKGLKNREETIKWIEWTRENYGKYGVGLWIVEEKGTGDCLGQCGLVLQKVEGNMEVEIGYLFMKRYWGKGYAIEAAQACKTYWFQNMKGDRLISLIDPLNDRSVKVARGLGMNHEKRVMKWEKKLDVYACYRKYA
ncbi:GNAT family N-acetyltransferase [Guptibacillus algicola]|uniref:GNAT family N-acetyltransferase n=1 Tax=Guptibacillus algicola TaxID=225844 RepID=UPI001CD7A0CA|nr:GNAT family N-acetyltransferase [Alkalihalobacillus algicola]MCA0988482.1 GNAT family N-acetyltransferase [Alkalihalobacillus algicola]